MEEQISNAVNGFIASVDEEMQGLDEQTSAVKIGEVRVLLVSVAEAAFLVASEVLSTLLKPISVFTEVFAVPSAL